MRNLKKYSNHSGPGGYMLYDAEVEYLESDKNQYIDVGIKPDANTGVMITVTYKSGNNYNYIFGCKSGSSAYCTALGGNRIYYFTNNTSTSGPLCSTSSNYEYTLYYNYLNDGLFRTSVSSTTYELGTFDTMQDNLRCLGCNRSNSNYIGKLMAFKVTQDQNVVRDMIPVRVGTVGYMYDKISGQLFGNSGSGSFVLGEDVGGGKQADGALLYKVSICKNENHTHYDKPYDSRIAYIEMPAGAYINSEQYITDITGMMYKEILKDDNHIGYVHNIYAHYYFDFAGYNNTYQSRWNGTVRSITTGSVGDIAKLELNLYNSRKFVANGVEYDGELDTWGQRSGMSTITTSTKPIYLGACSVGDSDGLHHNYGPHKCFAAQVTQGSELVLDLIPVRVGTTGYMYDRMSKRLFGNAGAGEFVLGPDI